MIDALRRRLAETRTKRRTNSMSERLAEIAKRCRQLPVLDERAPNEILGYDESGLPD